MKFHSALLVTFSAVNSLFVCQSAQTQTRRALSPAFRRNKLWSFHLKKFICNYFLRLIVLRPSLFYLEASAQLCWFQLWRKIFGSCSWKDGKDCVSKGICCARKLFFVKGRRFSGFVVHLCWCWLQLQQILVKGLLVDQPEKGISALIRKPYGDVFISAFPLSIFVYIKSLAVAFNRLATMEKQFVWRPVFLLSMKGGRWN